MLELCADITCPKSRRLSEVINIVNRIPSQKGVYRAVINGWWTNVLVVIMKHSLCKHHLLCRCLVQVHRQDNQLTSSIS